jgi:hypothetical protein
MSMMLGGAWFPAHHPEIFTNFLPINKHLDLFSMRQLMSSLINVLSGRNVVFLKNPLSILG